VRRAEGGQHVACDPGDPGGAGGLWWRGLPRENRLIGLKADTDVFTTFEGDNHVLTQLVAKELLTGYADDIKA